MSQISNFRNVELEKTYDDRQCLKLRNNYDVYNQESHDGLEKCCPPLFFFASGAEVNICFKVLVVFPTDSINKISLDIK